jgi:hypothetical protein
MFAEITTMNALTLQILDTLSSSLGDSLSINQLTERIKDKYGAAFYANTYKKLHDLKGEGVLNLDTVGKSAVVRLNFQNYLLIDLLAEMEIAKKVQVLRGRTDLITLLAELDRSLSEKCSIKSVCAIDLDKNLKLNRIELLFLLRTAPSVYDESIELCGETQKLQYKHNLRIDSLILDENGFSSLLRSNEINPLREALVKEIALFCPQAFWSEIKRIVDEAAIAFVRAETKPAKTSELDMLYNLSRFGYKELGSVIEQGSRICIEYITTALLLQADARRVGAVPVLLAKNDFNGNLLAFLSQKFGISGKLLGLLKVLQNIKPKREVEEAIGLLEVFGVKAAQVDERSILERMRLYNAG